ncbi:chemotaxis protein CheW [Zoogloea dura]|uniref:Chemotaxis protein CheW n=1 Tax=Zoogloea dura TaxID=2728840 RepID=A0A848G702_9RHOO|nr:chemotaxis protein CheW [Zoogloea dura]NML26183.1 chemotaxis protein CheW [Zoogloea dura]
MASWKGVDFDGDLARIVRHMVEVETYRESLQSLQAVWDNLTVLGQLSGTGTEITGMRAAFAQLTGTLLNSLATESRRKVAEDLGSRAQVSIDILIRNLFERTADIGFLATDSDLCAFVEAASAGQVSDRQRILARFQEYVAKYSVYSDILLLDRHGSVLCQLDEAHPVEHSADPLIREALTADAAYVERYGPTDLQPGAGPALIYAWRVCPPGGGGAAGVLCLVFRFANECEGIFRNLRAGDDWSVITVLDDAGRVLASSDPWQVPVGAPLETCDDSSCRIIRFAGREYMAATRATRGYQGYFGPGWRGHVMVPLEYAFEAPAVRALENVPAPVLAQVMESPALFSEALQLIPRQADAIQRELNRAVWNGNVRQSRQGKAAQGINASFSKTLLWEISNTGVRTKDIFERSIANLHETVVSTILRDCAGRAALAIDIMDRNLYERANDCRWWALTTAFREALAAGMAGAEAARRLSPILRTINSLYTVYTNLILFDEVGTVLAVSSPDSEALVGQTLEEEWVRRTLMLDNPQAYCVSAFAPTPLYGGRPTYIYGAAVRHPVHTHQVVGGIAIVFDAAPQLAAMLSDSLPQAAPDDPHAGVAIFAGSDGRVIAASDPSLPAGTPLALPEACFALAPGASYSGIVAHDGRLHAVAARMSAGYREYKGPDDAYRNDVLALMLIPLTDADEAAVAHAAPVRRSAASRLQGKPDEVSVELATFHIGGNWYGMHSGDIVESIDVQRITSLPGLPAHVRGCVMYEGDPIMVVDLRDYVNGAPNGAASQIVIVKGATNGQLLGLLVDELGEIPEVPVSLIQPVAGLFQGSASLVDSIVKTDGGLGGGLLLLLSADKLAARLGGELAVEA